MKTRKLTKVLKRFCHENGFNVRVQYGRDFAFNVEDEIVQYSFLTDKFQDELFTRVFKDEGLEYNCDIFILSFFHEIGHYMTDDNWTDKQSEKFMELKEKCNGETIKGNMDYFYMPDEIMATRWAVDFINENADIIAEFWKDVQSEIFEVYRGLGYEI